MLSVDDRRPLFGARRALDRETAFDQMDFNPRTGRWLRGSLALRGDELDTVSARLGRNPSAPLPRPWLDERTSEFKIDAPLLARVFPLLGVQRAAKFVDALNLYLARYEIDSVARMSAFFGQIAVESNGLRKTGEDLHYTTTQALQRAFGKRIAPEERPAFLGDPEKLANRVYANRIGNGDEASGDGWAFRGRGLIQLTGRDNYRAFSEATGVNAIENPALLDAPSMAVLSACWFWQRAKLNDLADAGQLARITVRINPAGLHAEERHAATEAARRALQRQLLWQSQ